MCPDLFVRLARFLDFIVGTVQSALLYYNVAHSIDAIEQTDFSNLISNSNHVGFQKY